jgi:GH18 family chitinase
MKQGAPKEKLMIGMPTYGRSFTLVDPTKFDIGAPASGGGAPGKYTGEAGFMSYYEVIYVTYTLPFSVFLIHSNKVLAVLSSRTFVYFK